MNIVWFVVGYLLGSDSSHSTYSGPPLPAWACYLGAGVLLVVMIAGLSSLYFDIERDKKECEILDEQDRKAYEAYETTGDPRGLPPSRILR